MRKFKESLKEYAEKNAPNLLRDYSEENPLSPDKIGASSTQEVIWICPFEHREVESVFKRKRRGYCSVCGPMENGSFAQVTLIYWTSGARITRLILTTSPLPTRVKFDGNASGGTFTKPRFNGKASIPVALYAIKKTSHYLC